MDDYRVDLDVYKGPLDLLLYLVRKNEVEIEDIPIALICDQYLGHLEQIKEIDLANAGDFILMAATLMDIKSRLLVPSDRFLEPETADAQEAGEAGDPRADLVRELLEYKRYRDRARGLEKALTKSAQRVPRPTDPSLIEVDEEGKPLREPGFGELVRAFIQVVRQMHAVSRKPIRIEDVPLREHIDEIVRTLSGGPDRSRSFFEFFTRRKDYGRILGLFLAILELAKERKIRIEQTEPGGDVFLVLRPEEEWIKIEETISEKPVAETDEPLVVDPESRITPRDKLPPGWVKTEEGYVYVGVKEPEKKIDPAEKTDPATGRQGDKENKEEQKLETPADSAAAPAAEPPVAAEVAPGTPAGQPPGSGVQETQIPDALQGQKKKKESVEDLISAAENFDLGDLEVEDTPPESENQEI